MRNFLTGLATGIALALSGTAAAAGIYGNTGYLMGWTVTKDGNEICYAPFVWVSSREIECD